MGQARSPGASQQWERSCSEGEEYQHFVHISSPVGQSSSLLLVVLLGEECSALLMAMNSSFLFIQLSSACWLQPQPAPSRCMTPPENNATATGTIPPPAVKTLGTFVTHRFRALLLLLPPCTAQPLCFQPKVSKPSQTEHCHPRAQRREAGPANRGIISEIWLEDKCTITSEPSSGIPVLESFRSKKSYFSFFSES